MGVCGTVSAYKGSLYMQYAAEYGFQNNRRCIDGKITGCGNCVGFCSFSGHPGFLTEKMRKKHGCMEKACFHYIAKPARIRKNQSNQDFRDALLVTAKKKTAEMEGIKLLTAEKEGQNNWVLSYIAISNEYSLKEVQNKLEEELDCSIRFHRLNYSFEICVRLIMAG